MYAKFDCESLFFQFIQSWKWRQFVYLVCSALKRIRQRRASASDWNVFPSTTYCTFLIDSKIALNIINVKPAWTLNKKKSHLTLCLHIWALRLRSSRLWTCANVKSVSAALHFKNEIQLSEIFFHQSLFTQERSGRRAWRKNGYEI